MLIHTAFAPTPRVVTVPVTGSDVACVAAGDRHISIGTGSPGAARH